VAAGRSWGRCTSATAREGKAEKWLKWICADTMGPLPADLIATGKWVKVKKKRAQRLYQVSAPGVLISVPRGSAHTPRLHCGNYSIKY
jgi:hypothetical protein